MIIKKKLPYEYSVFSAELFAIKEAVKLIENLEIKKSVIITDSKSAISAIQNLDNEHPMIRDILEIYNRLYKAQPKTEVYFKQCPSHSDIEGNSKADQEAKNAITLPKLNNKKIYYKEFLKKAQKMLKVYNNEKRKSKASKIFLRIRKNFYDNNFNTLFNRKDQVVLSRLTIGHTNLTHIHIISKKLPNQCEHCNCNITIEHILNCEYYRNHN